ncbi:MAG: DNA replication and repair protein RecF [Deltaproteobacteria bacterium]|nr:DNA replication and repair protein RecF [Deltaproteobacteria bacterium]
MYFVNLFIEHFRNLQKVKVEFSPDLNVIEGLNAQGKTNFLEALYLIANGHSFRTRDYRECIQQGQDLSLLKANLQFEELPSDLSVLLNISTKQLAFEGKKTSRWSTLQKKLKLLVFTPDSVGLFRISPSTRRTYLDQGIKLHLSEYAKVHSQYTKVLRQRKKLLEEGASLSLREPFDLQWAGLSFRLLELRKKYLNALLPFWKQRLKESLKGSIELDTFLESDLLAKGVQSSQDCLEVLESFRHLEERRFRPLIGPHLDDWQVSFNGSLVKKVASQGQQRLLVIALKLAEADLFWETQKKAPVFLLDDVGSELDPEHLSKLLTTLRQRPSQIFLSSAQVGVFKEAAKKVFRMEAGVLKENFY